MTDRAAASDDPRKQSIDHGVQQVEHTHERAQQRPTPRRGERGAAIVELAIVSSLLLVLVFGIITYAYMMSFRQSMTQAAAEGARAAALAPATLAASRGQEALDGALTGFDESCTGGGLTCSPIVPTPCPADPTRDCITITLDYDYAAFPLLPALPLLSGILPDSLSAESVVEIDQ